MGTEIPMPGNEAVKSTVCVLMPVDAFSSQVPVPLMLHVPVDAKVPMLILGNVACTENGTLTDAACIGMHVSTKASTMALSLSLMVCSYMSCLFKTCRAAWGWPTERGTEPETANGCVFSPRW
jgi:hypothetical protein